MKFTKSTADLQEKSVKNLKTPLQKKNEEEEKYIKNHCKFSKNIALKFII